MLVEVIIAELVPYIRVTLQLVYSNHLPAIKVNKMFKTTFNASENLWSGTPIPLLHNSKISVGHGLLRAMKTAPQKVAQVKSNTVKVCTVCKIFFFDRSVPSMALKSLSRKCI